MRVQTLLLGIVRFLPYEHVVIIILHGIPHLRILQAHGGAEVIIRHRPIAARRSLAENSLHLRMRLRAITRSDEIQETQLLITQRNVTIGSLSWKLGCHGDRIGI